MMEFIRKKFVYIAWGVVLLFIAIIYFFFYFANQVDNIWTRILETLNLNLVSTFLVAVVFGLSLYHIESKRGFGRNVLLQRMELRKRSLECLEEINKLIVKIRFYNTSDNYDASDVRISFEKITSFFNELKYIYKDLKDVVPDKKDVDNLYDYYQGWEKYFLFEKPDDLENYKKSIREAEGYLTCLKKRLMEFAKTLQPE